MASSELGLLPSFQPSQIKLDYTSDQQLEPGDADQFFEADFLRARIQLTLMKAEADIFIDIWRSIRDDIPDGERRCFILLLRPFFLKQITYIVSDEPSEPFQDHNLKVLSDTYIRAARSNLSIEIGLWQRERIAYIFPQA
ncbi:hypothetical protein NW765_007153 [Fusarium oxysporum]|nr:hypothetical protein NW765_007153 [Fusarium oxysporum]KAJ4276972.1 hypothetical protein NW764_008214 [Fusarium oxysporum]